MKAAELTRRLLKAGLTLSNSPISQWEGGHTSPTTDKLAVIARILGVNSEWLHSGQGVMRSPGDITTAFGRRLATIRKALDPDLPLRLGIDEAAWLEIIYGGQASDRDLALKIGTELDLSPGYVMFGDPSGLDRQTLELLLAAANDEEFHPKRDGSDRDSGPTTGRPRRRLPAGATSRQS